MDCGADYFMTPHRDQLQEVETSPLTHIVAAGGEQLKVEGQGKCILLLGDGQYLVLPQVQLVPDLPCPLLSVSTLEYLGLTTHLAPQKHYIGNSKGRVLMEIVRKKGAKNEGGLYYLPYPTMGDPEAVWKEEAQAVGGVAANVKGSQGESWKLWHSRMGHLAPSELDKLRKSQGVKGLGDLGKIPGDLKDC